MECCQCEGIEVRFDQKYVNKKLARYREVGPKKTTNILIACLKNEMERGMSLLDIGSGIGDIQHELLGAGVGTSINCEASTAYIEACIEEAERRGHANQITHIQGNFVEVADEVPPADIVTLDRVICCYHDMQEMVTKSLVKTRRLYGVVIPIDRWWVKLAVSIYYNLRFLLQRNPFRVFVHPNEAVKSLIIKGGFERVFYKVSSTWEISVYSRLE
jgi:magnesium-protoporphyrin O-methyltransferase